MNSKSIIGVNMLRLSDQRPLALKRCLDAVVGLALSGELQPTVGGRFNVDEIAKAHTFLEGRGSIGKVVVTWKA
jgi:NADPH2:quinone reductase